MTKYKFLKWKEAERLYPLAKLGDKVTVRSLKEDNYTGIYNGFGSKNASGQIDSKFFALYDLTRETRALFEPVLNEIVKDEYVLRECNLYNSEIERFTASILSREMRSMGYFQRVDFFSPSEYLNHLESGRPFKHPKSQTNQVLPKAKENVLRKLSPHRNKYFTQPWYYNRGPKRKAIRTVR